MKYDLITDRKYQNWLQSLPPEYFRGLDDIKLRKLFMEQNESTKRGDEESPEFYSYK